MQWSPLSQKALTAMAHSNGFINIYEGAVRSGKTLAASLRWIEHLGSSPHQEFLMTGKTADTLYRNVIGGEVGLIAILGQRNAKYKKSTQGGATFTIRVGPGEKTCYCLGANDERAEGHIRGMTIGGWYGDEITLYPETFVKQGLNRLSLKGAKAFWTMNPDSPYHYIKTEFIDLAAEKGFKAFHFNLDDNLSLEQEFKDNLRKSYTGLWYKRMVEGLWVMAEGVIYDMFDSTTMVVDILPRMVRYWVGMDYGTSNPAAFILAGLGEDNRFYVVDEFYYDSRVVGRQKSPKALSADYTAWIRSRGVIPTRVYLDPSAEGFLLTLWEDRVPNIASAENAVNMGLMLISSLMGQDHFRVHRRCRYTLKELTSYVWDPVAQKRGEDKPLKANDHCMDAVRYIVNSTRTTWMSLGIRLPSRTGGLERAIA